MKCISITEPPQLPPWAERIQSNEPQSSAIIYDAESFKDALYDTAAIPQECTGIAALDHVRKQGIQLLTAHLLDYLLAHPEQIPESWKEKIVMFPGTIFTSKYAEGLWVRFLWWNGSNWKDDGGAVSSLGRSESDQIINTYYAVNPVS